jgi:hypothetical protein
MICASGNLSPSFTPIDLCQLICALSVLASYACLRLLPRSLYFCQVRFLPIKKHAGMISETPREIYAPEFLDSCDLS